MSERENIVRKIRALRAKTAAAGCTKEEALAALALADKLMAEYELTSDDFADGNIKTPKDAFVLMVPLYPETTIIDGMVTASIAPLHLAVIEEVSTYAGVFLAGDGDKPAATRLYAFVGAEMNVLLACFCVQTIWTALITDVANFRAATKRDDKAFVLGWVMAIADKLKEMRKLRPMSTELVPIPEGYTVNDGPPEQIKMENPVNKGNQMDFMIGHNHGNRANILTPVTK